MSSSSTASLRQHTSSSSSSNGGRGNGGKVRSTTSNTTGAAGRNHRQQQQQTTTSSSSIDTAAGGARDTAAYNDKAKHRNWPTNHAFLPTACSPSGSTIWKSGQEYRQTSSSTGGGGESGNRKDDDIDERRLIIDLDSSAPTTTNNTEPGVTSAHSSSSSTSSATVLLALRQQQAAAVAAAENFHSRTTTSIMTTTDANYLHSANNVQPQQQHHQQQPSSMGTYSVTSTGVSSAADLVGLAQQIHLQQQHQRHLSNVTAGRIPAQRLQQQHQPPPQMVMPSQTPPAGANSYLFSTALSPYAAAQQLLLASAAVAAGANGAAPNPAAAAAAAQLFLPGGGGGQSAAALPYSYLMTAGFSPFCLSLNDAALAAAAAAAINSGGGQNQTAMTASAMANAGLLVPQSALASAALLYQQANGAGAGIRIQGSTATPPAGCNENMGIHKTSDEGLRRVSVPDIKNHPRQHQHVTDGGELLIQSGNNDGNTSMATSSTPVAALSREAVSEHIKRLISENEAIVEPPPALLKRRSYTKGHQGSASLDISALSGMTSNNGTRPPLGRSNRSQSLIDTPQVAAAANLKHSQQPPINLSHFQGLRGEEMVSPCSSLSPTVADPNMRTTNSCQFCNISFRNVTSLRAHEFRCANRVESILEVAESQQKIVTPPAAAILPSKVLRTDEIVSPSSLSPVNSASSRTSTNTPIGRNISSAQIGTSAHSSVVSNGPKDGCCGENKHPLKKRILAAAELDAQKFGSLVSTGVAVQSPPESMKSILPNNESGTAITVISGDFSPSACVPSSKQQQQQSSPSMDLSSSTKNVRLRTSTGDAKVQSGAFGEMKYPSGIVGEAKCVSGETKCPVGIVGETKYPVGAGETKWPSGETKYSSIVPAQDSQSPSISIPSMQQHPMKWSKTHSSTPSSSSSQQEHQRASVAPKGHHSPLDQHRFHPYRLTFKLHRDDTMVMCTPCASSSIVSSPRLSERVKPQLLTQTQTTSCCQRKLPIMFTAIVPVDCKDSVCLIWPQASVPPMDAKLNVMMMGGCNVRANWSAVKYVTAASTMSAMIVTPSSYWEQSKRLQQRLAAAVVAASTSGCQKMAQDNKVCVKEMRTSREEKVEGENVDHNENKPTTTTTTEKKEDVKPVNEVDMEEHSNAQETIPTPSTTMSSSRQRLKDILTGNGGSAAGNGSGQPKKVVVCNGGYKTNEAYTYVRGRGRGRYVCERCGIRCKKPSMLKKHIRTHLNVRPYTCFQCMFSFKTKGNLTKHMKSQAHSKKLASLTSSPRSESANSSYKSTGGGRTSRQDDSEYDTEEHDDVDGYSTEDDAEENGRYLLRGGELSTAELRRQRYSYKNVWTNVKDGCYPQRPIRTPPPSSTNPACFNYTELFDRCDTAPPALHTEPADVHSGVDNDQTSNESNVKSDSVAPLEESALDEDEPEVTTSSSAALTAPTGPDELRNQPELLSSTPLDPYFLNEGKCQCEICGKAFPKIGSLRLHMSVHYFEQTSRRYDYRCSFCNSSFRSRSLLQKHMTMAHQKQMQQQSNTGDKDIPGSDGHSIDPHHVDGQKRSTSINDDQGDNPTCQLPQSGSMDRPSTPNSTASNSSSNPRPFECADCKVAFRIHGHLAKHLRSKLHITKLENMGKLPIGLFAKLEESGTQYFAEIDTGDCASSLRSLHKLAEQFNMLDSDDNPATEQTSRCNNGTVEQTTITSAGAKEQTTSAGTGAKEQTTTSRDSAPAMLTGPSIPSAVSLACTEEMLPTSPAPPPAVANNVDKPTSRTAQDQPGKCAPTPAKPLNGLTNKAAILAAGIWVPPTSDKLAVEAEGPSPSTHNGTCNNVDGKHTEKNLDPDSARRLSKSPSAASPLPATTVPSHCGLCNVNFQSALELDIHWHADHVIMKDGNDFRCPRPCCDSVYPNRDSLRHHLALHFSGKIDENSTSGTRSETPNGDVSKATVAALSRKLGGQGGGGGTSSSDGSADQQEKPRKRMMKTQLVKLSSIPESAGNDPSIVYSNSNSCSSQSGVGVGGMGSSDTSPISVCGVGGDSDASRASINSSASPIAAADSPTTLDGTGRCSSGRQSAKRKSLDDGGPNSVKRPFNAADHAYQLLQLQAMHQQALSSTPPGLNGFYQRLPTPIQSQSPVIGHANGGTMTPNSVGGWSPSPLLQQLPGAKQQISPPQPFYFPTGPGGAAMSPFFGLQHPLASVAMAQHNAAKILAAGGGMNQLWNSQLAASHLLSSSATTPEALNEAVGFTGLHDAGTAAAALGFLLPQSCILCGKQYANNAMLQEHLLTHALARPFVCEHCDAGFTTEQALQSHRPCRQQRIDV